MKPIQNIELVEISIVAGVIKYKIPTQTNFRGKKIVLIQACGEEVATVTPLGKTVLDYRTQTGYITLDVAGQEKVKQLPLSAIDLTVNVFPRPFEGLIINNDKSFVEFPTAVFEAGDEVKAFLLLFFFED